MRLADSVSGSLAEKAIAARTVTLKVRFGDFRTLTRSVTLLQPNNSQTEIIKQARKLSSQISCNQGVRLLGVSVSNLGQPNGAQLRLDEAASGEKNRLLGQALAKIRDRFGNDSLAPASLLEGGKVNVIRDREFQWGQMVASIRNPSQ